jgi:hypothetical protein
MRTANKQLRIAVAKIPEFTLIRVLAPERRYARRWLWRTRALPRVLYYVFLKRSVLLRQVAPGQVPFEEHEWRAQRHPRLHV